jgi:ABC-type phosphate/phosphonate transport system substrate-binding protein
MNSHPRHATEVKFDRRTLGLLGLGALLLDGASAAPAKPAASAVPPGPWRIVVNEAVTGDNNIFLLSNRYRALADFVGARVKVKPVNVEPVVDIQRFMEIAQGSFKPELVFGKSVNQLAKLVRDNGYQPLVRRSDPYKAAFIVAKGSTIKTLGEAAGGRIVMPDEFAATTAVARAELLRQKVGKADIRHVRYQESVAQQVQAGWAQVGVVNPTIAKKWAEQGGRVLAETQPVVNWSVLASPDMPAAVCESLREALLELNTQQPALIAAIGVKQWARADTKDYLALLDYTKE